MAITRYAGDRFVGLGEEKNSLLTKVIDGALYLAVDQNKQFVKKDGSWIQFGGSIDGSGISGYVARWSDEDTLTSGLIFDDGVSGVGINTTSPQHALHVSGDAQISGYLYDSQNSTGEAGYILASEEGGPQWKQIEDVLSGVGGSGAANYVARWADEDTLTSGVLYDNGTNAGAGTISPLGKLDVLRSSSATPGLIARSNKDGAKMNFAYTNTNSMGEIGMSYYNATGGMELWVGGNLNSNSASHVGPTQQHTDSPSWYSLYKTHIDSDFYQIKRISTTGSYSTPFHINGDGKVGIGTTSPSQKLEVNGGRVFINNGTNISPDTSGNGQLSITGSGYTGYITLDGTSMFVGHNSSARDLRLQTNETTRVTIDGSTGNVGIGTDTPDDKLDIVGDLRISVNKTANTNKTNRIRGEHYDITEEPTTFMFMNNFATTNSLHIGGGSTVENAATQLNFYTASNNTTTQGSARMVIDSSGDVGIGTISPSYGLDVAGNARVTTDLFVNDQLAVKTTTLATSNNFHVSSGTTGSASKSSIALVSVADNSTYNSGVAALHVINSGNRGTKEHSSGSDLLRLEFSDSIHTIFNKDGNVGIGTTNPQGTLDLGNASVGKSIVWGGTSGTNHYTSIWSEYSSGSLVLAGGLKSSTTNEDFIYPYTGTYGYAAIELDSFQDDGIKFYTAADAARTAGAVATKQERMRLDSVGDLTLKGGRIYVRESDDGDVAAAITRDADEGYLQLFSSGTQTVEFRGNGNSYFNGGNVGIGTDSPDLKLDVQVTSAQANLGVERTDGKWATLYGGSSFSGISFDNSGYFKIAPGATANRTDTTGTGLVVDSSGNVGIGTTSPDLKLHINNAGGSPNTRFSRGTSYIFDLKIDNIITNSAIDYIIEPNQASSGILFRTHNSSNTNINALAINRDGNVGIGTLNPLQKLHVVGSTLISNNNYHYGYTSGGAQATLVGIKSNDYVTIGQLNANNVGTDIYGGTGNIYLYSGSTNRLTVSSDVNVQGATDLNINGSSRRLNFTSGTGTVRTTTSNKLFLQTNSTDAIIIDGSQHVGIGTASPTSKLQIVGSASGDSVLKVDGTSGTIFEVTDDLSSSLMSVNTIAGLPVFEVFADYHIVAGRYNQNDFYLDTNGNLGLGTSTPRALLDVSTAVDGDSFPSRITSTDGSFTDEQKLGIEFAQNALVLNQFYSKYDISLGGWGFGFKGYSSGLTDELFTIGANGNVGLGATNPIGRLHIYQSGGSLNYLEADPSTEDASLGNIYGRWDGDNTSLISFRSGSDTTNKDNGDIAFYTSTAGGSLVRAMTIDENQKVGIGTASPGYKLDVVEAGGVASARIRSTNANVARLFLSNTVGTWRLYSAAASNSFRIFSDSLNDDAFVIKSDGKVGIGTNDPDHNLQVDGTVSIRPNGSSNDQHYFTTGGVNNPQYIMYNSAGTAVNRFRTDNYSYITGGNVGIGTTLPSQKLHVQGTLRLTGAFYDSNNEAGVSGQVLTSTGSATDWKSISEISGVTGSGTINKLPLWNGTSSLTDSIITQSSTNYVSVFGGVQVSGNHTDTGSQLNLWCDSSGHGKLAVYDMQFLTGSNSARNNTALFLKNDGNVGIGTTSPGQQLHLTGSIRMPNTTSTTTGIIYKDTSRFIHNYQHPTGDTAVPAGLNTFVGISAGNLSMGSTATSVPHGSYNSGFGYQVLNSLTTGYSNTAVGFKAGNDITTAIDSTLVGMNAGGNIVNGSRNTFIGDDAGFLTTSGANNVVVGAAGLRLNTTGSNNTVFGTYALQVHTSPSGHTALGYFALSSLTTGSYNIAIGYLAASQKVATGNLTNASYGIYLGYAVDGTEGASGEIVIGKDAKGLGSNTTRLGGSNITKTVIEYGNVGIGTTDPAEKLHVTETIRAGSAGNSSANLPALRVYASGTNPEQSSIAIQQGTTVGDTIIFADYEPYVEYGINTDNGNDTIEFTAGTSTNNLGSKTLYNNSGAARTAYKKVIISLLSGNMSVGGNVGIGNASPTGGKLQVAGKVRIDAGQGNDALNLNAYDLLKWDGANLIHFGGYKSSQWQELHFYTNGADALTIDASQNVGIGTANPPSKFTVAEGTDQHGVEIQPGTVSYIQAYDRATSDYGDLSIDAQTLRFATDNGAERVRIDTSGNVGIGTVSPTLGKLQVAGKGYFGPVGTGDATTKALMDTYSVLKLKPHDSNSTNMTFAQVNSGAGIGIQVTNGTQTADWDIALNPYGGNVGIGTTDPNHKLEVAGETHSTHFITGYDWTAKTGGLHIGNDGLATGAVSFYNSGDGGGSGNIYRDSNILYVGARSGVNTRGLAIDINGNVGIGIASPVTKIHGYTGTTGARNAPIDVLTLETEHTNDVEYNGFGQGIVFRGSTYNQNSQRTLGRILHQINDSSVNTTRGTSMSFQTSDNGSNANAPTTKVTIDYKGDVGIGTASPANTLHVNSGGTNTVAKFESTDTDARIRIADDSSYSDIINSNGSLSVTADVGNTVADSYFRVNIDNSEKLRIISDGNVGIGTPNPNQLLDVDGITRIRRAGTVTTEYLDIEVTDSVATFSISQDEATFGGFIFNLDDNSGSSINSAFRISNSTPIDLLTVRSDGKVGIGTPTPEATLHIKEIDTDEDAILKISPNNGSFDPVLQFTPQDGTLDNEGFEIWYDNNVGDAHIHTIYNNDAAAIRFHTRTGASKSTSNERLTIAGDGNVGIGTTNPSKKLDVNGDVKIAGDTLNAGFLQAYGSNYNVGNNNYGVFLGTYSGGTSISPGEVILSTQGKSGWAVGDGLGRIRFFLGDSSGVGARDVAKIEAVNEFNGGTTASGALAFYTSPYNSQVVERLRIASDGNIGMGSFVTGSPVSILHVKGSTGSTFISVQDSRSNTDDVAGVRFSTSANATVNFKSFISHIETGTNGQGDLIFAVNNSNTAVDATVSDERMRIKQSGGIKLNAYGVGGFTSGTVTYRLAVNASGDVMEIPIGAGPVDGSGTADYVARWTPDGNTLGIGLIRDDNSTVAINTAPDSSYMLKVDGNGYFSGTLTEASSLAIKENIENFTPSIDKINKIRPVKYNKKGSDKKEIGLIAEELEELFPELVEKDENGNPSGVNYSRAVTVLLGGFKELYKELQEIKKRI
ncbi:tail fiber domain-containing protein [Verrucomicrobia bacterium]|nr:tail fiber domain-containing protein [Verrucomicrobiota bacterium]